MFPFVYLQPELLTAFCTLKSLQASWSDWSNQILLDKYSLHSLMVKHSCGINKTTYFLALQMIYIVVSKCNVLSS